METGNRPVVVVGSINMDLVARAERIPVAGETVLGMDFQTHPGGKGANQAVAVARLGYPVRMIGRLGDDAFGEQLRSHMEQAGVELSGITVSPGSSGVASIVVSAAGDNCIVVVPGANALLTPEDLDRQREILESAGMVLAQLEIPIKTVEHLATLCTAAGVPLMLDPAPACPLSPPLLSKVEWFTPNESEAGFYTGGGEPDAIAAKLIALGVKHVLLKQGVRGARLFTAGGGGSQVTAVPVAAVDTTAAGDAFNGAFATALMLGREPVEAARFASAAAAVSVTRLGAQSSMATLAEVQEVLRSQAPSAG